MWQSHHMSHSFIFVKFTLCHRPNSAVASNDCAIDHLHKNRCMQAFGRNTLSKPHTEWNEGTDKDITVLHWLSKHTGLTSECVTEVIKLFTRWQSENMIHSMMWNEAAKHAAVRQVMWPPPHPAKAVEPNTASSSGEFKQIGRASCRERVCMLV